MTKCCPYAVGLKPPPLADGAPPATQESLLSLIPNPDVREYLSRMGEYRHLWLRSPATWQKLTDHLRALNREVSIWVGGTWTGREGYSAGLACENAGISSWRVDVTDTNDEYIKVSAGPRGGRFRPEELTDDLPGWVRQHFVASEEGFVRIGSHIRDRVTFTAGAFYRDHPPACDVAVISNVWRQPTRDRRNEQAEFPHRDVPLLSLRERRALAARIHGVLSVDGILMLDAVDLTNAESVGSLDLAGMLQGRSGVPIYDPPLPITELFEPLDPEGPPFQLLWRKKMN